MSYFRKRAWCPSICTVLAAAVGMVGLAAWWTALHPSLWGGHEFSGMFETFVMIGISFACAIALLLIAAIGVCRKNPWGIAVLAAVAVLAACFFQLRDRDVWR